MNRRIIFISLLTLLPFIALAQDSGNTSGGLVKCGITNPDDCGYAELIDLIQTFLNYLIYTLATPIAVLMIGFSGFQMITSGGDQKKYENAKKVLTNILIAYGVMLGAFLVIKLIFAFMFPDDYSLLG